MLKRFGIRNTWSRKEDAFLKKLYSNKKINVNSIAKELKRNSRSIWHRVSLLISRGHLKRRKKTICDITGAKKWTRRDVRKLVSMYLSKKDQNVIARKLKRSKQSTYTKLTELRNIGWNIKKRGFICH
jgi:hypothetical protein